MPDTSLNSTDNQDQITYWNSDTGDKWIKHEGELNSLMQSVCDRLLTQVDPGPAEKVLEIGCGAGAMAVEIARRVGPEGRVLAVDISQPMLARARENQESAGLKNLEFLLADAQSNRFVRGGFDLLISRFGVMFFSDPVQAFSNLRSSLRPGGRLCFACWGAEAGIPWFRIPREVASARLGAPAAGEADAAGPMRYADSSLLLGILRRAGFENCEAQLETVNLRFAGSVAAAASLATKLGPAIRIMNEFSGTQDDYDAIGAEIEREFQQFKDGENMRVPADIWFYTATNP